MNTILVIEDEHSYQRILSQRLTQEGYEVSIASDGEAGLALALEHHPDLVVLDLTMPKMDGMEVLRNIRISGDWGKRAKIIIMTALSSDNDDRMRGVSTLEPIYYFEKTKITIEELVEKIIEILPSNFTHQNA